MDARTMQSRLDQADDKVIAGVGKAFGGGDEPPDVEVHPDFELPSGPKPGVYGAEGDPYTYKVNGDGSVSIVSGPTGEGAKLTKGKAFDAILAQIKSGQLTPGSKSEPPAPDDRLRSVVTSAMEDHIERPPTSSKLPPNMRTVR